MGWTSLPGAGHGASVGHRQLGCHLHFSLTESEAQPVRDRRRAGESDAGASNGVEKTMMGFEAQWNGKPG
jgi:hypothetical protein